MNPRVFLKPGKDKPVRQHHPWIFSGAIARAEDTQEGDTVDVLDAAGRWLARGYYNSRSQITVRIWTWEESERVDREFLRQRLANAFARRDALIDRDKTDAYRLVNAESDLLPGLVVDRYADYVILQFLTLGVERRKQEIVELLQEMVDLRGIFERSDVDVREKEGLTAAVGALRGSEPPAVVETHENGLRFLIDVRAGHKTGFYLDQRENRKRATEFITDGARDILNVFSYTGAFAVYICRAHEHAFVTNLDSSEDSLALARQNMDLNRVSERGAFVQGDAFQVLRHYRDEARSFDAIIMDPPKFVYSRSQLESGLRGYKDVNLLALKLLRPGGTLITFSCSGLVGADLFQKVVFGASVDAHRDAQVLARLLQSPDHPILISFPESEYLKGLVCRVL